jgi:hypothetical protein
MVIVFLRAACSCFCCCCRCSGCWGCIVANSRASFFDQRSFTSAKPCVFADTLFVFEARAGNKECVCKYARLSRSERPLIEKGCAGISNYAAPTTRATTTTAETRARST